MKYWKKNKNAKAFTLAEMLITLAIIGIIATLTVPTLMKKYENHRNVVVLKKAYATIANEVKMFMIENDCGDLLRNCVPEAYGVTTAFSDYLVNTLNYKKEQFNGYLPTSTLNGISGSLYRPVLYKPQNGSYTLIFKDLPYDLVYGLKGVGNTFRTMVYIITNPNKNKPTLGRDLFFFAIADNGKIIPGGAKDCNACYYWHPTDEYCTTSGGHSTHSERDGIGCAAKIIQDGWQMKY